jgi:5-methylcytosine-specific restriction protein A
MSKTENWTSGELAAAVDAYFALRTMRTLNVKRIPKKPTLDALLAGPLSARSKSSIERRFSNISYVMASMGEEIVDGYKPLSNVGARVKAQIEGLIRQRLLGSQIDQANDDAHEFERRVLELRRRAVRIDRPAGTKKPKRIVRSVYGFVRSPEVKAYVLQQANGRCEVCTSPAPFLDVDGMPFLEVHHVKPLADGGSDRVGNAIAVCPNCHRRAHFSGDKAEFLASIFNKLPRLTAE